MSFYGYNPADYIYDWSRFGHEIGSSLEKLALTIPALIEYNKQVKENKKWNEEAYQSTIDYVNSLDNDIANRLAAGMGASYDIINNNKSKDFLMKKIEKPDDKIENEKYEQSLIKNFYIPLIIGAKSNAGGNLKLSDLIAGIGGTPLADNLIDNPYFKSFFAAERGEEEELYKKNIELQKEKAIKDYELDIKRNQTEQENKILTSSLASSSPVEARDFVLEAGGTKELADYAYKKKEEEGNLIVDAINNAQEPEQAYEMVVQNGGTVEQAKEAYNKVLDRKEREKKILFERISEESKKSINLEQVANLFNNGVRLLGSLEDDLTRLNSMKKNGEISKSTYYTLYYDKKNMVAQLKRMINTWQKSMASMIERGESSITREAYGNIVKKAAEESLSEASAEENKLIEEYKKGKINKKDFIDQYTRLVGSQPIFNKGKDVQRQLQKIEVDWAKVRTAKALINRDDVSPKAKENAKKYLDLLSKYGVNVD